MNNSKLDYRAWADGKMYYDIEYITMDGKVKVFGMDQFLNDPVIMQFIGLRDKDERKIYAGDAVQSWVNIGVIEFSHGVYGINWDYHKIGENTMKSPDERGLKHNLRTLDDGYNNEIVIIGNVFEHNEQLRKMAI